MKANGRGHWRKFRSVRRAVTLVWESARGWTLAALVLMAVQGLLPLAALTLMKLIIDLVTRSMSEPPSGAAPVGLLWLVAGAAGIALASAFCRCLERLVTEAQSQTVTDHVYDVLHAKSIEADLEYYESAQYYDTLHLAQQEAPYRPVSLVNSLVQLGQNAVAALAILGLLAAYHWGVVLIILLVALPGLLVRFRYARLFYRWHRRTAPLEREASYFNWMLTGDAHAKEVRLFDLGSVFTRRFNALRRRLRRERLRLVGGRSLREFLTQTFATLAVFGALAFVATRTVRGEFTIGTMVMLFMAFQRGHAAVRGMLMGLAQVYESHLFLTHFDAFLDLQPRVREPAAPRPVPSPLRQGIIFRNISFRYPDTPREVVHDVSFHIDAGEHVALVGHNGAGKTTLVKLLCRLYDPDGGAITVDGVDLREFAVRDWRRQLSVVFQDFVRYHLTARENIRLGNVDLAERSERIESAARLAGAHEVIASLPRGYDTQLGRWFEEGEELSAGQWQAIALARAFLRESPVIVLDEPTSALDPRAEFEVFQRFHELVRDRTAVIISHRMSTVRMADRIIVLDGGRILESGSHETLLARGGKYAELFRIQSRGYQP